MIDQSQLDEALRLMREAQTIKGDPIRVLQLVQEAAGLLGLNASDLIMRLSDYKNSPGESIEDVLKRMSTKK